MTDLLIYGANGYTGELIARLAVERGERPVLGGRSEEKVRPLAEELGLDCRIFGLEDSAGPVSDFACVLHCAGPFRRTSKPMVEACVRSGTHYLDITGEIEVFEALAARTKEFEEAGVMVMPGVGADVVPSDCLAVHVAGRLPTATHLELGLLASGGMSHGTATTALQSVNEGGAERREGRIRRVPAGHRTRTFDFGRGARQAIAIPWGDVSTAYYSTGIPNIVTYFALPPLTRVGVKAGRYLGGLMASPFLQARLQALIDRRPAGPDQATREAASLVVVAEVSDAEGTRVSARLNGPSGYSLTALAALLVAKKVLAGDWKPGFQTPAAAYGADLVLQVPGVSRVDLA